MARSLPPASSGRGVRRTTWTASARAGWTTSRRSSRCPAPSGSASRWGPRAAQLRAEGWHGLIRELPKAAVPFDATADALTEVDLIITVDTVLAHLAGAVGRPVWVLLSSASDWRWMLGRTDTPWYPTMRLFRQPALDDWDSVFGEVRDPGSYPIQEGMTVLQALSLAGGSTEFAALNRLTIMRVVDGEQVEIRVRLDDLVQRDDTIRVPVKFF